MRALSLPLQLSTGIAHLDPATSRQQITVEAEYVGWT